MASNLILTLPLPLFPRRLFSSRSQHIKRRNIDPVDLREDGSTQGPPFAAGVRDVELLEQQSAQEAARERQLQQLVQVRLRASAALCWDMEAVWVSKQ